MFIFNVDLCFRDPLRMILAPSNTTENMTSFSDMSSYCDNKNT